MSEAPETPAVPAVEGEDRIYLIGPLIEAVKELDARLRAVEEQLDDAE